MNGEFPKCAGRETRRDFLKKAAMAAVALGASDFSAAPARSQSAPPKSSPALPWYRRVLRWEQTNITERDPTRYDVTWSVQVKLPDGVGGRKVRLLVSGAKSPASVRNGWSRFEVKSVLDHEVILIQ